MSWIVGITNQIARILHWLGELLEWIAESWSPMDFENSEDEDDELEHLSFDGDSADDAINCEALDKERLIRQIVATCVQKQLSAETIRVNLLGLCRSLGALSQLVADESSNKQTCMEAAGVIAMTTSCERMLRSVSDFQLIRQYRFTYDSDN